MRYDGILKNRTLDKVKNAKPFEFNDVFVYAGVVVLIAVLFCVFVIFPKAQEKRGFAVFKHGETVVTFTFDSLKFNVNEKYANLVEINDADGGFIIVVYTNANKDGFNKIFISTADSSAKVTESSCSSSKDCTFCPAITDHGAIYCHPHGLKICVLGDSGFIPPTVG